MIKKQKINVVLIKKRQVFSIKNKKPFMMCAMCFSSFKLGQMELTSPIIRLIHAFILGDSTFDQERASRLDLIAEFEQELERNISNQGLPVQSLALINVTVQLQTEVYRFTEWESELSLIEALIESLQ